MPELQNMTKEAELSLLHASTCLSMTHFINGHHCPQLPQRIVHQINRLLLHPDLNDRPESRDLYLQMLDHWQEITRQLLKQRRIRAESSVYH